MFSTDGVHDGITVNGVKFNDPAILENSTSLGASYTFTGYAHFWINPLSENGTFDILIGRISAVMVFKISLYPTNKIDVTVYNNENNTHYKLKQSTNTLTANAWNSVLISWNTQPANGPDKILKIFINDVESPGSETGSGSTFGTYWPEFTKWIVGNNGYGSNQFKGQLARLMLYIQTGYMDFTVEANRRKFITADNKPADIIMPPNPRIYLPNPASSIELNAGTGGNFTKTGSFTDVAGPGG